MAEPEDAQKLLDSIFGGDDDDDEEDEDDAKAEQEMEQQQREMEQEASVGAAAAAGEAPVRGKKERDRCRIASQKYRERRVKHEQVACNYTACTTTLLIAMLRADSIDAQRVIVKDSYQSLRRAAAEYHAELKMVTGHSKKHAFTQNQAGLTNELVSTARGFSSSQ